MQIPKDLENVKTESIRKKLDVGRFTIKSKNKNRSQQELKSTIQLCSIFFSPASYIKFLKNKFWRIEKKNSLN